MLIFHGAERNDINQGLPGASQSVLLSGPLKTVPSYKPLYELVELRPCSYRYGNVHVSGQSRRGVAAAKVVHENISGESAHQEKGDLKALTRGVDSN